MLIANALAALLQPSCYDSIIMIKKLPYLPDILPSSSNAHKVYVEDFMLRDVKYIWRGMNYRELREVLKDGKKLRSFPLVDNPHNMILLGSIQRTELIQVPFLVRGCYTLCRARHITCISNPTGH